MPKMRVFDHNTQRNQVNDAGKKKFGIKQLNKLGLSICQRYGLSSLTSSLSNATTSADAH